MAVVSLRSSNWSLWFNCIQTIISLKLFFFLTWTQDRTVLAGLLWILLGPEFFRVPMEQPLRFQFQSSFIDDESKCRLMLISAGANFKSFSPVPLGIDKSAHDKQNEAICHPSHSLAGNPLEIPSCELDWTGQQDSNVGQLQKMSWENYKRKREGAEATMNKTTKRKQHICIWTFLVIITRRLSNKPTLWDSWQITNTSQCLL